VALEVRPGSLGIVRVKKEAGRLGFAGGASLELPKGVLELSITQPNILDSTAFEDTLRALLTRAGIGGGARIGLVLPDPVARVALVPTAEVQARGKAALDEVMRFKLRKSVPFEIRESRIAVATARHADSVVAVVIFQPVLEAYERACLAVGLQPGLVELAGFALLRAAVPAAEAAGSGAVDRLLVNWDEGYVTLLLARGDWPLIVRTLTGEAASAPREVIREVANTVLYYRERLGGKGLAQALLRSAALPAERAAALLAEALGMTPQVVEPLGAVSGVGLGATTQALAGAAACLSGGIA
jgi:Tfp pilus assembly PilM family ATPase